jgi:hypothetical protein
VVRRAPGVPVADDAEAGPDLEAVAPVSGLLGDHGARPPVVAMPRRGEQTDDLDDVQVGLVQGVRPAGSLLSRRP